MSRPISTVGDLLLELLKHAPETPLGVVFYPPDEWNPAAIVTPCTATVERKQRSHAEWESVWGPRWFDLSDSVSKDHSRMGGPIESVVVLDRVKR